MAKGGGGQQKPKRKNASPANAAAGASKAASIARDAEKAIPVVRSVITPDLASKRPAPSKRTIAEQHPAAPDDVLPDDFQATFGENLKAARLKSGLKQSDVAEQAGLTQQRLSRIENGPQNLTLKTMVRLAAVVDHHVSALLLKKVKRRQDKG